jgi:hypothetical protein
VAFVAHPDSAPQSGDWIYVRPDDLADEAHTWRALLLTYNQAPGNNPLKLLPAFQLYRNEVYRDLVDHLGISRTFILSAGWGLIPASFLTPAYDITFSASAEPFACRRSTDSFTDFAMLDGSDDEPIVFLGGKEYVPHFVQLTSAAAGARTVFYNSANSPIAPECLTRRFQTTTRTNWHYECARALVAGELDV